MSMQPIEIRDHNPSLHHEADRLQIEISCGSAENLGLVTGRRNIPWGRFCEELKTPRRDKHTQSDFQALEKSEQSRIKAADGWYVAGEIEGPNRRKDAIGLRWAIVLDLDAASPKLLRYIERELTALSKYEFIAHETHSSTDSAPRLRVIILLASPISAADYPKAARAAARLLVRSLKGVDAASFEASRAMFWPSRAAGAGYWCYRSRGIPFSPPIEASSEDVPERPTQVVEPVRDDRAFQGDHSELESALNTLKNDDRFEHRRDWLKIMFAIHHETRGSEGGRDLAHRWSKTWSGDYDSEMTDAAWDSATSGKSSPITGAYIMMHAIADGYRPPRKPRDVDKDRFPELDNEDADGSTDSSPDCLIRLAPAELNQNLEILDGQLADRDGSLFQRSGEIVCFRDMIERAEDGELSKTPQLIPVTPPLLQQMAMRVSKFEKYSGQTKSWIPAECPENFARHYLNRRDWSLRYLFGILPHPTLRRDGSILETPGYDDQTSLLVCPNALFPAIPPSPSRKAVADALERLRGPVRGFDFADDAAFAVWLACVITMLIRPALPIAPIFGFDAPCPGSGKTKLALSASMIALGEAAPTASQPPTPEEEEKRLLATFRSGRTCLVIDNCTRPMNSEHLCTITTASRWGSRVLGVSEERYYPTTITIIATGNQLAFRGDLASRAFVSRLTPRVEDPRARNFDWSFEQECLDARAELVVAALTIVRAHVVSGRGQPTRTRFPDWDRLVRQSLIAAGLPDICRTMQPKQEMDRDRSQLREVLLLWESVFGTKAIRLKQIGACSRDHLPGIEDLRTLLGEFATPRDEEEYFDPERFGKWLRHNRDVFSGGRVFRCEPDEKNGGKWRVEQDGS